MGLGSKEQLTSTRLTDNLPEHLGAATVKHLTWNSCFGFLAVVLIAQFAGASVVTVDDFDDGTIDLEATHVMHTDSIGNQATTSAIGGFRSVGVALMSDYLSVRANSNPMPGVIAFSSGSQSIGFFDLTYAGEGGTGLGGIDITNGGTNRVMSVDFAAADMGAGLELGIEDSNGNFGIFSTLVGGPGVASFALSDFTDAGVDLTSIEMIDIAIIGEEDGDYTIDSIYAAVPEPGTIAIWSILGVGTVFYTRRRQKI